MAGVLKYFSYIHDVLISVVKNSPFYFLDTINKMDENKSFDLPFIGNEVDYLYLSIYTNYQGCPDFFTYEKTRAKFNNLQSM